MTETFLTMVPMRDLIYFSKIGRYRDNALSRHRMIQSIYPSEIGDGSRKKLNLLYRFEKDFQGGRALIRSSVAPASLSQIKTITEKHEYKHNDNVGFRVVINPIKRNGSKESFLTKTEDIEEYVEKRFFEALKDIHVVSMSSETLWRTNLRSNKNFLKLVQIDAVATVDEEDKFLNFIKNGVGRNKNYGAGLITARKI